MKRLHTTLSLFTASVISITSVNAQIFQVPTKGTGNEEPPVAVGLFETSTASSNGLNGFPNDFFTTPISMLCLRLKTPDRDEDVFGAQELDGIMQDVSNQYRKMSFNKTSIDFTIPSRALELPRTTEEYESPSFLSGQIWADARQLARDAGFEPNQFDIVAYLHPQLASGGVSSTAARSIWMNGRHPGEERSLFVRQIAHSLSLKSADAWISYGGAPFGEIPSGYGDTHASAHRPNGNPYDILGASRTDADYGDAEFNVFTKSTLGWIPEEKILSLGGEGIGGRAQIRVHRSDDVDAVNAPGMLALKVQHAGSPVFWIGYRRDFDGNPDFAGGAHVLWQYDHDRTHLLDMRPEPNTFAADFKDAPLAPGKSFVDPSGSVRITAMEEGGTAPHEYIKVEVHLLSQPELPFELSAVPDVRRSGLIANYFDGEFTGDPAFNGSTASYWPISKKSQRAGVRVAKTLDFMSDSWGSRLDVGFPLAPWNNFSVQWDGYLLVHERSRFVTFSDDASRMWIDLSQDRDFSDFELFDNQFSSRHTVGFGEPTPVLEPGSYRIRIQYTDGSGENIFRLQPLAASQPAYTLRPGTTQRVTGLMGSYVNENLRDRSTEDDWRTTQTIAGTRPDKAITFTGLSWGTRSDVGLTHGSDANWDEFSVQWDGEIEIHRPIYLALASDDSSRMWIDLNQDGNLESSAGELTDNRWGNGQTAHIGERTPLLQPGTYKIRIQYEEATGENVCVLQTFEIQSLVSQPETETTENEPSEGGEVPPIILINDPRAAIGDDPLQVGEASLDKNGNLVIQWPSKTGVRYDIERSHNLINWTKVTEFIGSGDPLEHTLIPDPSFALFRQAYLRVVSQPTAE